MINIWAMPGPNNRVTIKHILKKVKLSEIELERLKKKDRHARTVKTRYILVKEMRECGYSYPEIGKTLNRHHTSIMHLYKNYPINQKQKEADKNEK